MISHGKELLRISPANKMKLEFSTDEGRNWRMRFSGSSSVGEFSELFDFGKEIQGMTSKGLYYSTDDGRNWRLRSR